MRQHPDFRRELPEVAISERRLSQVTVDVSASNVATNAISKLPVDELLEENESVVDSPVVMSSHPGLVGDQVDDRSVETSLSLELPEAVRPITTDGVLPDPVSYTHLRAHET